jgi:peptide/nickel transport system substrate-binding protein
MMPGSVLRCSSVRLIAAVLGLAITVPVLALAAAAAPATAASGSGATLRVESQTAFSTFNPFTAYFDGDLEVIGQIYPTLTMLNVRNQLAPYLATKWSVSSNKLTWTLTIRPGLKWSDGKPLTAADAAWTLNLIMHNSTAGTANGALVAGFASVTAPNATTLVITTRQPEANMLYLLNGLPIVPEHIWASQVSHLATDKNQATPVVGYGPWTLTGYAPDQYATLTASKSFFMGAPKFHRVIVQYYSNSDAAVAALRSGQLDAIEYNLDANQFEALKTTRHIATYPQVSGTWVAIELNPGARTRSGRHFGNGDPVLTDMRVRQAIAYALNRKELVAKVMDGLAVPEQYTYDPARASQMLTAAGYKMGPGGIRIDPKTHQPLTLRLGIHSDEASDAAMAPYIVEWLKAIGIQVNVQSMSFNQLNTELPKGDWDMLSDTWSTGPDPTYLLSIQTCGDLPLNSGNAGNTDAFFCNKTFDNLYARQTTEFSTAQRVQTLDQMQQILFKNAVDVILYYPDWLSAVRTDVVRNYFYGHASAKGFYPTPNRFVNWLDASPVAASGGPESSATLWIVIAVAAVVVLAGAGLVIRRRATAAERE